MTRSLVRRSHSPDANRAVWKPAASLRRERTIFVQSEIVAIHTFGLRLA